MMTSPIFFPLFVKKYVVQTRHNYGEWKDYNSYKNLAQAERAVQELAQQNPKVEARIFNRFTGQVMRT
jgi:hypothetical protein